MTGDPKEGEDYSFEILFKANPKPTLATWTTPSGKITAFDKDDDNGGNNGGGTARASSSGRFSSTFTDLVSSRQRGHPSRLI